MDEPSQESCHNQRAIFARHAMSRLQQTAESIWTPRKNHFFRLRFARPWLQSSLIALSEDLAKPTHILIRAGNQFTLLQHTLHKALFLSRRFLFKEDP